MTTKLISIPVKIPEEYHKIFKLHCVTNGFGVVQKANEIIIEAIKKIEQQESKK